MKKQTLKGCLALGAALGVIAPIAQAQTTGTTTTTTTTTTMSSQPMLVTGRVNNYWTDASGYVTAVDVQTANGPAVVRFAPSMGNRLMQTYPVGSTANVWVQGSMEGGTQNWDLVGVGDRMPANGFWPVMSLSGLDLVTGWPMIDTGAERVTVQGNLRRVVVDQAGQVVGLIIDTKTIGRGTAKNRLGQLAFDDVIWSADKSGPNAPMMTGSTANTPAMAASSTGHQTLIRVGPEYRNAPNRSNNMRRVTPIVVNDDIVATGYMESTRYGAITPFAQRLIATAIAVNSRSVGQLGFPEMNPKEPTLIGLNLNIPFITGKAPDALQVVPGGYEVYSGSSGGTASMTAPK